MRRLTSKEARLLTRARWLLDDLARSADAGVMTVVENAEAERAQTPWEGYQLGLIRERCERAERAIFDALNGLSAYGDDLRARAALNERREGEGAATDAC